MHLGVVLSQKKKRKKNFLRKKKLAYPYTKLYFFIHCRIHSYLSYLFWKVNLISHYLSSSYLSPRNIKEIPISSKLNVLVFKASFEPTVKTVRNTVQTLIKFSILIAN